MAWPIMRIAYALMILGVTVPLSFRKFAPDWILWGTYLTFWAGLAICLISIRVRIWLTLRRLLRSPSNARRVWVEHDADKFFAVMADFGKGARLAAAHAGVLDAVVRLEKVGCAVESVPAWCRAPDAKTPEPEYND